MRQLLTEALVIAAVGAALGVLIAWRGLALIVAWVPTNSFAAESVIEMNLPVLLFSTALAVVTAIVFGVWPALQLSRPDLGRVAQVSARRVIGSAQGQRIHRVMVAAQVALTLLMLTAAGAAGKGIPAAGERRSRIRPAEHHVAADPRPRRHVPDLEGAFRVLRAAPRRRRRDAAGRVGRHLDQRHAAVERRRHHARDSRQQRAREAGRPVQLRQPRVFPAPPHSGDAGTPLERVTRRRRGAPLAVINQTMARQYWPNGDAVGRQFRFATMKDEPPYSPAAAGADGWLEIVGVVADARNDGLRNPIKPAFYVPYTLKMRMFTQILVRTRVPPLSILRDVRAELVRVDREQQVMRVRDLQGWITNLPEYAQQRLVARLFGIFSVLALALSAVGLYSVVSYGVATRTNEFGIRMALGARARDVVRMVLSGTSWNVGAGLLAGVLLCLVFDNVASRWVTESSRDPLILGGVTVLLLAVAVMACLAPARRAASIDPMDALRHE